MKYLQVPAKFDQKQLYYPKKENKHGYTRKTPNGYYLIAHELLTPAECKRINAPVELLTPVEIKKTNTFICFGARFEMEVNN